MTKAQFLSLLVPSVGSFVLVILAWLYSNARLGRVEALLDKLADRLGLVEHDLREFYRNHGEA